MNDLTPRPQRFMTVQLYPETLELLRRICSIDKEDRPLARHLRRLIEQDAKRLGIKTEDQG